MKCWNKYYLSIVICLDSDDNFQLLLLKEANRLKDGDLSHRRNLPFFGNPMEEAIPNNLNFNNPVQLPVDPPEYSAQNGYRRIPDE